MSSDYALEDTVYLPFTTRAFSTGIPTALVSGEVQIYEDASITQITTAETLTVSLDGIAGFNMAAVAATTANGFESGKSYTAILSAGTVDSVSAIGEVIGHFTLEASATFARLGAPAGASVSADIAAIEAQTDDIGAAGAGLTAVPWNATWDAEVQSEVNDALVALHLDHLLAVNYDPAAKPGVATALLNEIIENDGGVSRFTTNSLENGPGGTSTQPILNDTTISGAPTSNTQFILAAGSADNDAYNNQMIIITDATTGTQKAVGLVSNYIGSTKEIFLDADPGIFTFAATDIVQIFAVTGSPIGVDVDAAGRVNVGKVFDTTQTGSNLTTGIAAVQSTADNIEAELANGTDGLTALSADIAAVTADVATAQADLNTITGTDGVTLATAQALYAPATAASLTTVEGKIDTIDTEVGLIQADLDNGTDGLGAIKTDTAAIKTKTDSLTFTKSLELDANVQSINGAQVLGDGNATPWDGV